MHIGGNTTLLGCCAWEVLYTALWIFSFLLARRESYLDWGYQAGCVAYTTFNHAWGLHTFRGRRCRGHTSDGCDTCINQKVASVFWCNIAWNTPSMCQESIQFPQIIVHYGQNVDSYFLKATIGHYTVGKRIHCYEWYENLIMLLALLLLSVNFFCVESLCMCILNPEEPSLVLLWFFEEQAKINYHMFWYCTWCNINICSINFRKRFVQVACQLFETL